MALYLCGITGGGGGVVRLGPKTITQNGTYNPASDNLDGYNSVTVDVAGGGTGPVYYLNNGKVAQASPAQYITTPLDTEMLAGMWYQINIRDGNNEDIYAVKWDGTETYDLDGKQLEITSTTAGLTYYSGNYRDIYCDIIRIGSQISSLDRIFHGYEDEYNSDSGGVAHAFDTYTEGTNFSTYVSTSDHGTFTVLKDFMAVITYGVMQDPNRSSSNVPNGAFYKNGTMLFNIDADSATSGDTGVDHNIAFFTAGDTFFWGSINSKGYAVRMGAIDVISTINLNSYVEPGWT